MLRISARAVLQYVTLFMIFSTLVYDCAHASTDVATNANTNTTHLYVDQYRAHIEPDIAAKTLKGRVAVRFYLSEKSSLAYNVTGRKTNARELILDAQKLQVDSVQLRLISKTASTARAAESVPFKLVKNSLVITLPSHLALEVPHEVDISYRAVDGDGIIFTPEHQQVFTAFSTSQWMPCIDAPSARATFELTLVAPGSLQILGNGRQVEEKKRADGRREVTWRLDTPMPSYLYGFAVGPFREVIDRVEGKTTLRYLTPQSFSESEIRKIFADTRAMLAFYKEKTGIDYPFEMYTQLLVKGSAAQEMSTYAVMGERYGERVLADEKRIWLGAHELAHQWWGNAITNRDWREMWLNEGIATFMNVAFLERRFGRDEYMKQIDASRLKYEKIRDAGNDKTLIFPSWDAPTPDDRALVYDKGSYVVHLLREQLGEEKFWAGMRGYAQAHTQQSVSTVDFKRAMETASGQNLSVFFEKWIYQASAPAIKK